VVIDVLEEFVASIYGVDQQIPLRHWCWNSLYLLFIMHVTVSIISIPAEESVL
jgi:hypothetical protein